MGWIFLGLVDPSRNRLVSTAYFGIVSSFVIGGLLSGGLMSGGICPKGLIVRGLIVGGLLSVGFLSGLLTGYRTYI